MKKLIVLLSTAIVIIATSLATTSCDNDAPTPLSTEENAKSAAHNFSQAFAKNFNSLLDHPITTVIPSRSPIYNGGKHIVPLDSTKTPIFVEIGPEYIINTELASQIHNIKTPRQLMDFARRTGAQLTLEHYGTHDFVIEVDEADCREALTPMIEVSKNYLIDKGFTPDEINQLLIEAGCEDYDIISLVIAASAIEGLREEDPFTLNLDNSLITSTDGAEFDPQTIERALWCLGVVVGIDTLQSLSGKALTKAALKVAVKTTLRAYMGAVGAMLAMAEWSACYWSPE